MKKIIIILFIILFCGCADYKELNDIAIVSGISIDREKDEYSVGILIANSTDGENVLYKTNGKTISDAIKKLESITPKQLYLGHLGVVILCVSFAETLGSLVIYIMLENPALNIDRVTGALTQRAFEEYLNSCYEKGMNVEFFIID